MFNITNHQGNADENHEIASQARWKGRYKKPRDNRSWWGSGEKGSLVPGWWECKLLQSLWKTVIEVPQEIKNRTNMWSSSSTSELITERNEITILTRYLHPMFTAALFTIAKTWKLSMYPLMQEWIKKCDKHTTEHYSVVREGYSTICSKWMKLEDIMLSETGQK